jgi:cytochrome c oxidase subunit 4
MSSPTSPQPPAPTAAAPAGDHSAAPHAVPVVILVSVFAALMVFTLLTVAATWIDLGEMNIWIALAIALIKAALVCLYFMHLRYDSPFNGLVLITALAIAVLFIAAALTDSKQYEPNIKAGFKPPTHAASP